MKQVSQYEKWYAAIRDSKKNSKLQDKRAKKRAKNKAKRRERDKKKLAAQGVKPLGKPSKDYVRDDGFYSSRSWREIRYLALKNCGAACQCCGARAGDGIQLHVDHILPRYRYPHLSLELSNLQVLCGDCNMGKGAWDETDFRQHFKSI